MTNRFIQSFWQRPKQGLRSLISVLRSRLVKRSHSGRARATLASLAVPLLSLLAAGCSEGDVGGQQTNASNLTPQLQAASQSAGVSESASSTSSSSSVTSAVTDSQPQSFSDAWGPSTGTQIPLLRANDQAGQPQTLASLSGEKGLLLVFSRSADW